MRGGKHRSAESTAALDNWAASKHAALPPCRCSYGRWWEARSAIGRMFNWPRIIVRLVSEFICGVWGLRWVRGAEVGWWCFCDPGQATVGCGTRSLFLCLQSPAPRPPIGPQERMHARMRSYNIDALALAQAIAWVALGRST